MFKLNILTIFLVSLLIGCSNSTDPDYNQYYDSLAGLDVKQSIALGNEWKFTAPKIKTHVTSQEAIFEFPSGRVIKKTIPIDSFYVAIAPYINTTHTCETHYPSSCDGEIKEKTLKVIVTDESTNILFNGNIKTLKNGFFELWLPRNKNIKIDIQYNSSIGTEIIPTKDDSRTCITTIKLE